MQLTTYAFYTINYICHGNKPATMKLYAIYLQDMSKNVEKYLTEEMLHDTKRKMTAMHDDILEKSMNGPFPASPTTMSIAGVVLKAIISPLALGVRLP